MKMPTMAALLLAAAQPAMAADFAEPQVQRSGAFAGFRLRVPIDGGTRQRQVRAGFAVAPMLESRTIGGESRLRFGEGLEFGLSGRGPMRLSIAGRDVRRLAARENGEGGGGIPTGAWIAGGLVVAALVGVVLVADVLHDANESGD